MVARLLTCACAPGIEPAGFYPIFTRGCEAYTRGDWRAAREALEGCEARIAAHIPPPATSTPRPESPLHDVAEARIDSSATRPVLRPGPHYT